MDKSAIEKLKQGLEEEKAILKKELERFALEDKNIKGNWDTKYPSKERGDKEEEADETQEYDNLLSLEHSLELKLKDVNSALDKIKNGVYGKCERCSKEIEPDRLTAYPEAKLCIECNKQS